MNNTPEFYRRRLPHVRIAGASYFVTWRLNDAQLPLTENERSVVAETLRHFDGERYSLFAYVVMDDHVHCIVEPVSPCTLDQVVHSWKSFIAHRLQRESERIGSIWQHESYDHVVRDERELLELATYVWNNPYRRWTDLEGYSWRMARGMEEG